MFFEIDFIPVGDGEKGGDAAALRVWDSSGNQLVFVVDGGTKESGDALVEHIKTHYNTTVVNAVFCTHPDADHSSGLSEVLEKLTVQSLIMHRPWAHAGEIKHLFDNRSLTLLGLSRQMRKELEFAHDLEKIAIRRGIPVHEPFAGNVYLNGIVRILGPSTSYYETLLPQFRSTPEPAEGFIQQAYRKVQEAVEWVAETMQSETLTDEGGHFSAENSSSAVILFTFDAAKVLFTGDADIEALSQAALHANESGIRLDDLHILDVPHHGSRHNVGPTILNYIKAKYSHISAPTKADKHPAKKVVNALIRRGSQVYTTQGKGVCYPGPGVAMRAGWNAVTALPFSTAVEK